MSLPYKFRPHFALLLMASCSLSAVAQKKIFVAMDTSLTLLGDKCNFKEVKVIDDRQDKSRLGTVGAKDFKKAQVIVSETSLDTMLANFTLHYIKDEPKSDATCLIVVRDFNISYSNKASPTFYFNGDMFIGKNGQYRLAAAIDTLCDLEYDTDGSGTVEFQEFKDLMKKNMKIENAEQELKRAFRIYD